MHLAPLALLAALALTQAQSLAQNGAWLNRGQLPGLASCSGELFVYDSLRHESLWFRRATCHETWTWNGGTWTQRTTTAAPPTWSSAAAYDSARNVVVALSGNQSTGMETWEWNGSDWHLRAQGGLPGRHSFSMAFDAARNVTLMFGGNDGSSAGCADTWAWNGTSWTQVWYGGPSPRWSYGLTYDAQRQKVVLFGGRGPVNGNEMYLGDTWEWNGSYWFNYYGVPGPSARMEARLAYDSTRQRTLLYGGITTGPQQDTWTWNGTAWTQLTPMGTPGQYPSHLAYDSSRDVFTALSYGSPGETWEFVPANTTPATFATYGSGCAGPAGVPQLTNVAGSLPRIGSTLQLRLSNLPSSPFNLPLGFLGFDATIWNGLPLPFPLAVFGFPGCDALLAPIRSDSLTNINGAADWSIALPMNAFALGADLYFQGAVLVPGWNPGGFVFSNGGHAVVGSP